MAGAILMEADSCRLSTKVFNADPKETLSYSHPTRLGFREIYVEAVSTH
jgi:hypothetical protein